MNTSIQKLSMALLLLMAIATTPAAVLWLTQSGKHTKIAIVVAFMGVLPFILALIWIVTNYRRFPTPFAKNAISILSVAAFVVMPAALWWMSLYDPRDRARVLPIVIAALDTAPLVLGIMWFAFQFPRYPEAFGRWFTENPKLVYLFILFVLALSVLRLFRHT